MKIYKSSQLESDFKLVTKQPKYSKEQKVVKRALEKISKYIYYSKNVGLPDLYQAIGLLESLMFDDDKEQQCEPSSVK